MGMKKKRRKTKFENVIEIERILICVTKRNPNTSYAREITYHSQHAKDLLRINLFLTGNKHTAQSHKILFDPLWQDALQVVL